MPARVCPNPQESTWVCKYQTHCLTAAGDLGREGARDVGELQDTRDDRATSWDERVPVVPEVQ